MRVKLVIDAIELAKLVYKGKTELESMEIKGTVKDEPCNKDNVLEDIKEIELTDIKTSDDTQDTTVEPVKDDNKSEDDKKASDVDAQKDDDKVVEPDTSSVIDRLTKPIKFYSSAEDAQCLVTQYEDGLCMVFRGTTNTRDWMTNLDAILDPLNVPGLFGQERPYVHSGFLRQFQSIMLTLMQHATRYMDDKSIKESNKTFYYMGHSLGGALSTVAAVVFGMMFPDARHVCITFGSPRVGNDKFCDLFRIHVDESVRCVNQEDPVPGVPTACRFNHVYGLAYIDKNHDIQSSYTENRMLNTCKDSVLCCCGLAENPVNDHDLLQYKAAWVQENKN